MNEYDLTWVNVANVAMAAVLLGCLLATAAGVAGEFVARRRKRSALDAELDRDMRRLPSTPRF
jgi:hypothetical protein